MGKKCEICGAGAGLWSIELHRREGQKKPDFTLTLCNSCLPRALEVMEQKEKDQG